MPGVRALGLALAVGIGVAVYFAAWFRWPTFLAIGVGATMGIVLLLVATSLADDPAAADAAWRAAAPDLAARERAAPGLGDREQAGLGAPETDATGPVDREAAS